MKTFDLRLLMSALALLTASCAAVDSGRPPAPGAGAATRRTESNRTDADVRADWWTAFSDPALAAAAEDAARKAPREENGVWGIRRDLAARAAKAYIAVAEGLKQEEIARAFVETCERTLAEVRQAYASGRCASDEVQIASKDLTWANNLFRQRRERLGFEVRRLERLVDRPLPREYLLDVRLPDLPEGAAAGDGLEAKAARLDAALDLAAVARRRAEDAAELRGGETLALLAARRVELQAQSRWIALRGERLERAVDRLRALDAPGDPVAPREGPRTFVSR